MLEHLFGSKTRAKLLTLFVHHPAKAFFVRELTRLIETQINAVRRELENLVELGLVNAADAPATGTKHPGLKRKYYKMNEGFPLIAEVRTLITKAHVLMERRLDREITTLGDVQYAALLGAFIGRTGSPVDLFLVGTIDQKQARKLVDQLEKEMGFEINFTCMPLQDFNYRKEITDRFLYSILEAPKSVLINKID
ncbi:hypothetical protein HY479_01335 [Candidatus Uhrbacteria bacterium]|nr:hypothetical protein [Candidatus Uhrbacteria bacterium]